MTTEVHEYHTYPVRLARWDADVAVVRVGSGRQAQTYFAFRHLCEAVGIGYGSQLQVLKEHPEWYPDGQAMEKYKVDTAGGYQEMVFLRKQEAAWWLGHLNPKRCKDTIRGRIEEFASDLKAAADRLAWGDISDVESMGVVKYRPIVGKLELGCPRCGVPLILVVEQHGVYLVIDEKEAH